jgi:hypothetical protein
MEALADCTFEQLTRMLESDEPPPFPRNQILLERDARVRRRHENATNAARYIVTRLWLQEREQPRMATCSMDAGRVPL